MSSLVERIAASHNHPNDDLLQEGVLRDAFVYLTELNDSLHLFCDPNNYPVAIHALVLFSFMESDALEWYKKRINSSLSSCRDCIVKFHQGRFELHQSFMIKRQIEFTSVKEFNDIILSWESERVVKQLEAYLANLQAPNAFPNVNINLVLTECLYGPSMFRVNPMLKTLFSHCFINCLSSGKLVPPVKIFPGLLYLIYEGSSDENRWCLEFLKTIEIIGIDSWDSLMTEEFLFHLINIQDPQYYSDRNCIKFWTYFKPFLRLMTPDVIESNLLNIAGLDIIGKAFPFQVVPLNVVLSNQLFAFLNTPLAILLSVLNIFISKLGPKFWKIVKPFTFLNFIDPIFGSPHYTRLLRLPVPDQSIYEIRDLFSWIHSLYNSLPASSPQRQQAGLRISLYLLDQVHNGINNGFIIDCAFGILLDTSKIENQLYDPQLSLELLSKVDTRAFINIKYQILFSIARGGNNYRPSLEVTSIDQVTNKLRAKAIVIISNAILYDIYYFAEKGHGLKENKNINLGNISNSAHFWNEIISNFKANDIPFAVELFKALSKMSCIVPINEKLLLVQHGIQDSQNKNSSVLNHIRGYNIDIAGMFDNVKRVLDVFNSFDGQLLKTVLIDPKAAMGYWSCILSSNKSVYQSATNLLYEAFDVEGRLEGVRSVLASNQHAVLHSLHNQLTLLILIDFYDPCPSAVRVLMDIVSALNSSVDGVFIEMIKSPIPEAVVEDLRLFWKKCWLFLDFIYRKTLSWAQVFPLSLLTDFTRDTLDFSHMLIDCYSTVESIVKQDDLFKDIMDSFQNMLVWLRLGDLSLLSSCVALIFKTLDLSEQKRLPMSSKIIELLAKYGAKAKKFNNKLTEKQRVDILDRARSFDEELVQQIILSASGYRNASSNREKASSVQPEIVEIDDDDSEEGGVQVRPGYDSGKIRQTDLSKFITRSNTPSVAPAPKLPPLKTSLLLAAKLSLAAKRINAVKLTSTPAPPRPSGFNRKKTLVSDSDSSDSDSNDEVDSLFHPIKKDKIPSNKLKSKVISLAPKSLSISRSQQKKQVDQKELDAFNMRMRLNVDLAPLYTHVLSWSYSRSDDYPEDLKDKLDVYKRITDSFKTHQEYAATFEPLLLLECWQSIQQSKQIGQESAFPVVIASRTTTNAFYEVYASIRRDIVQDKKLSDSDLIVLSFHPEFSSSDDKTSVPSRDTVKTSQRSCLAKIKEIKVVNPEFCDVTFRVSSKNNPLASFLTPRAELFGMKVMQMITIEREYSSLKGLQYYDLSKQIIQAIPNIPEKLDQAEKDRMIKMYDVNPSQAQAIAGSVHADGFSLIQGPPGTGKTKTIMGIIGYILTSARSLSVQSINVPGVKISDQSQTRKNKNVLICAPSNAAVDELVLRLRSGIKNANGELFHPNVVRLGRSDAVNPAVKDLTLEELIDKELNAKEGVAAVVADPKIREEHNKCIQERNKIKEELLRDGLTSEQYEALNQRLKKCVQRKNDLGKQLDEQREKISKSTRSREIERRALQAKFLTQAQVICSTLSGSAHDVLASLSLSFDTVVIDEAAQCIELSAIIPLRYGCKKCVMVGDPNQLPPTVLSQAAASYAYEQSLFVRMQTQHPNSVYLLDVQYRMHPEISKFPSAQFYDSKLIDGPNMKEINTRPWHKDNVFSPYLFYNIAGAQSQNQRTKSFFNNSEAKVALELVEKLFRDYYDEDWTGRIGIISPYKEQINLMRDIFIRKFGRNILREIDFNTVDGFQGQEKEIIIMSCVRASESHGVGFLSDVRRMNVALTRSKTSLWILGHRSSLSKNNVWSNLIYDASKRNVLVEAGPGFFRNPELFKSAVEKSSLKEQIANEVRPSPVVELTKSGIIQPPSLRLPKIPKASKQNDTIKSAGRVTVPFIKQKRNVLSAETIKAVVQPNSKGKIRNDSSGGPARSSTPDSSGSLPAKLSIESKENSRSDLPESLPAKLSIASKEKSTSDLRESSPAKQTKESKEKSRPDLPESLPAKVSIESREKSRSDLPESLPAKQSIETKEKSRPDSSGNLPDNSEIKKATPTSSGVLSTGKDSVFKVTPKPHLSGNLSRTAADPITTPKPISSGSLSTTSSGGSKDLPKEALTADPRLKRKLQRTSTTTPLLNDVLKATNTGTIPSSETLLQNSDSSNKPFDDVSKHNSEKVIDNFPTDPRLKRKLELHQNNLSKKTKLQSTDTIRTTPPASGYVPPPSIPLARPSYAPNTHMRSGIITQGSNGKPLIYRNEHEKPDMTRPTNPGYNQNPNSAYSNKRGIPENRQLPPAGPKRYQQVDKLDKYNYQPRYGGKNQYKNQYGSQSTSPYVNQYDNQYNNQYNNQYSNQYSNQHINQRPFDYSMNENAYAGNGSESMKKPKSKKNKPKGKKKQISQSGNLPPKV